MPILKSVIEEKKEELNGNVPIEEVGEIRRELVLQKQRIEEGIKRFDRKNIDEKIVESLRKLRDINDSVSDLQNALNIVWKRTKQIEEELKEALRL